MLDKSDHRVSVQEAEEQGVDVKKYWLTAPNGKIIKPVDFFKGRPVYKYDELLELGPPYSGEPAWD